MIFYLASGFNRRYLLRGLRDELQTMPAHHKVISSWIDIEDRIEMGDPGYDEFAAKVSLRNLEDLKLSNALIIDSNGIFPDNKGGVHFEYGWSLARGNPVYLIGPRTMSFHWLPWLQQFKNSKEFIDYLT